MRKVETNKRKAAKWLAFILLLIPHFSFGLDFNFRPKGFVFIPMGEANKHYGNKIYSVGGGGELGLEVDFSTVWPNPLGIGYTLGILGGMQFNPMLNDTDDNVAFYSAGGVLGLYFFPTSRFFTRADGAVGVSASSRNDVRSDSGLFWRSGAEFGFRFTPGFTLAANAGWQSFYSGGDAINAGIYAGLTAQVTFQTGSRGAREGVIANLRQPDPLYPAFMQLYQANSIGAVTLRNNENAEIRDVRMFFRAGSYTASEFPCGTVGVIPRGRTAELPLLADFSPDILRFTDAGRVIGELVIRYKFLGQEREVVRAVTVAVYNRNSVPPGDPAAFAAFVSPSSPEVLDFARFIAGLDRSNRRTGHNTNMQYAIWLFEGLRASGIRLGETYTDETEAQYPAETLAFSSGSSRDLVLLYAAALESVGIPTAFIETDNDFMAAFSLGIGQSATETLFSDFDKILIIDNEAWLPLSMSAFNEGFTGAWTEAVTILQQTFAEGMFVDFIIVQDAWATYPPAPIPELGRNILRTDNSAAITSVNITMRQYIENEIHPLVNRQIALSDEQLAMNNGAGFNRLGILQVRAEDVDEAKEAYEQAARLGSVPAMTNRGNLALAEQDYDEAERWFREALQHDPENRAAQRGMMQIESNR